MSRASAWRAKCPAVVSQRIAEMGTLGLLMVQQNGPTSFVLKDPSRGGKKFKVKIGGTHTCSCSMLNMDAEDLCHHVLFVLCKIFRLPHDNPLVWQKSFLESEIEKVIEGRMKHQLPPAVAAQMQLAMLAAAAGGGGESEVKYVDRKPIQEGEDSCPICCDEMNNDRPTVFCRFSCGNNIHAACFKQYAAHNATTQGPLLCPLCRGKWGPLAEEKREAVPGHGVGCSSCKTSIDTERYQCAFCTDYNLCSTCFFSPSIHPGHPFDVCLKPGLPFQPITRPLAPTVIPSSQQDDVPLTEEDVLSDPTPHQMAPREATTMPSVLLLEEVVELERRVFTNGQGTGGGCEICGQGYQVGDALMVMPTQCKHFFHEGCLSIWLMEEEACCPVDRQSIRAIQRELAALARPGGSSSSITASRNSRNNTTITVRRPNQHGQSNTENVPPRPRRVQSTGVVGRRKPHENGKAHTPVMEPLSLSVMGNGISAFTSASPSNNASMMPGTNTVLQQRRTAGVNSAPRVVGGGILRPPRHHHQERTTEQQHNDDDLTSGLFVGGVSGTLNQGEVTQNPPRMAVPPRRKPTGPTTAHHHLQGGRNQTAELIVESGPMSLGQGGGVILNNRSAGNTRMPQHPRRGPAGGGGAAGIRSSSQPTMQQQRFAFSGSSGGSGPQLEPVAVPLTFQFQ